MVNVLRIGRPRERGRRDTDERFERMKLVVVEQLNERRLPWAVGLIGAECDRCVVGLERGGQTFSKPDGIFEPTTLNAGVVEQLVNCFVHRGRGFDLADESLEFRTLPSIVRFVVRKMRSRCRRAAIIRGRFFRQGLEVFLHLLERAVRIDYAGIRARIVEDRAIMRRRVVPSDGGIGDRILLAREGAVVHTVGEENGDELVAQRLGFELSATTEPLKLVVRALQPLLQSCHILVRGIAQDDEVGTFELPEGRWQQFNRRGARGGVGFQLRGSSVDLDPNSRPARRVFLTFVQTAVGDVRYHRQGAVRRRQDTTTAGHAQQEGGAHGPDQHEGRFRMQRHLGAIGLLLASMECFAVNPPQRVPIDGAGEAVPSAPVGPTSPDATAHAAPPRYVSVWIETPADLTLPVFDGRVVQRDGWLAVIAGMTGSFSTTPAIQLRHPERGWLPIGSQLLEGRARFTMTPLDDKRFLVVGGVQGSIENGLTPLASCEVLDPFIAGSRSVPPLDEPLVDHTAHALNGGCAAVIGGSAVRIFDGREHRWIHRIPLIHPRVGHASVQLDDRTLLVLGGDDSGTIELIELGDETPITRLLDVQLPKPLVRFGAIRLQDGRVWIVGGVDQSTGRSTDATWFLDPRAGLIVAGPKLVLEHGIADPRLVDDHGRVLVLGGEWVGPDSRGEVEGARFFVPEEDKLWSLAPLPERVSRRMWYTGRDGRPAALGGYRFIDEVESARIGRAMGPEIVTRSLLLRVGGAIRLTD